MTKGYEQRKKSNQKYLEKFDEIKVRVPKGEKEKFQQLAKEKGESLNSMIYDMLKNESTKRKSTVDAVPVVHGAKMGQKTL